jgi:hypothetical protein
LFYRLTLLVLSQLDKNLKDYDSWKIFMLFAVFSLSIYNSIAEPNKVLK